MNAPQLPSLDMAAVAAQALGTQPKPRAWSLEYLCDGILFKWAGYAATQGEADQKAREYLDMYLSFSKERAQLSAALEV